MPLNRSSSLKTRAEATDYAETSLHKDVLAFVDTLVDKNPLIKRITLGQSGEGQDMVALIVSDQQSFTPTLARKQNKIVVMVEANIHAGEVEGKESVLALARDLTLTPLGKTLLSKLCLVMIPNFNPDGNDRISPSNRKLNLKALEGQVNPPGGVGTRYTGEGWNLNRDAMKQEAIETKNLARLHQFWNPDVFIDCHTTDGSLHGFDLTYDTSHSNQSLFANVLKQTRSFLETVSKNVNTKHGFQSFWYGNYLHEDDPNSGWHTYPALPRFGSHYRGLLGKIDILLETYSYIDFKRRCQVMYAWLLELFREIAKKKTQLLQVVKEEQNQIIERGIRFQPNIQVGINYGIARRDEQNALVFDYPAYQLNQDVADIESFDLPSIQAHRYPGKRKQTYQIPHLRTFFPTATVATPAGYLVPNTLAKHLDGHGIQYQSIPNTTTMEVEAYFIVAIEKTFSPDVAGLVPPAGQAEIPLSLKPPPKRFETVLTVRPERKTISVPSGTLLVKTAQPTGTLAVYLLEPHSDDGFTRWEFLDSKLRVGSYHPIFRLLTLDELVYSPSRKQKTE